MCHSSTSPLRYSYSKGLNVNRGSSLSSVTSACPANSRAVKSPPKPPPMITTFAFEFILLPSSGEMSETLKWYQSLSCNAQHLGVQALVSRGGRVDPALKSLCHDSTW